MMATASHDPAHVATDKLIAEMEKKISAEYSQAVSELTEKLNNHLSKFEEKDKKKLEELAAGTITQEAYDRWRTGQIMTGERWENMRNAVAQDLHNANRVARSIVNGYMPEVYALNHNYGAYEIEKGLNISTSLTLYDRPTVERLMRENPELLQPQGKQMKQTFGEFDAYKNGKKITISPQKEKAFQKLLAENRDIRWQKGKLQSVTLQAILQGESIPNMARRIARDLTEINRKSSIRYARTATTSAENAGRIDSYKRAESMGIEMLKEWMATADDRTRDSHIALDGVKVGVDDVFPNGCAFPGDPSGPASEVWNCRCTLIAALKGFDSDRYTAKDWKNGLTFDEWQAQKAAESPETAMPEAEVQTPNERPSRGQVDTGYSGKIDNSDLKDYNDQALRQIMQDTGFNEDQARRAQEALQDYFGGDFEDYTSGKYPEKVKEIDDILSHMPAYDGSIYRGMTLDDDSYSQYADLKPGDELTMRSLSSWTSKPQVAARFGDIGYEDSDSVIIRCAQNQSGAGVQHISKMGDWEAEVLSPSGTSWRVVGSEKVSKEDYARDFYRGLMKDESLTDEERAEAKRMLSMINRDPDSYAMRDVILLTVEEVR